MPELPDVELYLACLRPRVVGKSFGEMKLRNPFVLRTVSPAPTEFLGVPVSNLWRIGKRVAFEFDNGTCMVIHLMVSGRFQVLVLTEASSKKRAGIWMSPNRREAMYLDAGGLETLDCTPEEFGVELQFENRTLKRALTDPRRFSGIGNAYSDEILHAARLSPLMLTQSLQPAQVRALHDATAQTLTSWRDRLVAEFDGGAVFPGPGKVTAFRPDFAVHGKFGKPCPDCGKPVQRIVYAENETNYCAMCQNAGRILADRAMSRLLKSDWPRSFAEEAD